MARRRPRADLRQPRRLRHAVRPPQRRRRATPRNLERFDARLARAAAAAAGRRSAGRHRRSRQRSDDAEHRSLARVRAAARRRARACAAGVDLGHAARRSPISARRWPSVFGVGAARARHELSGRDRCVTARRLAIRACPDDPRAARSARARDPRAAGGEERRLARPPAARSAKTTSGRRFSAIAIASSTARRSAG